MIFSQSRQENFSRTVRMTFQWRGITSRVSVKSSPSFDSFADPQQGQFAGAAMTMSSRGRWLGNGYAIGGLRSNDRRSLYGNRSERKARLLEQMELQLEDLEAFATEDELTAQKAAARTRVAGGVQVDR